MSTDQADQAFAPKRKRSLLQTFLFKRELFLVVIILAFGGFASLLTPYFLDMYNFKQVLIATVVDGIVAIGMTMVLVSGGLDLSVGSIIGLSGIGIGLTFSHGQGVPAAMAAALACGLLVGGVNGLLIAVFRINPIIATLGMMGIARSATFILSGGYALAIPNSFSALAEMEILGVPSIVIFTLVLVAAMDQLLKRQYHLVQFFYVGGNEEASFKSGIPVRGVKFASYILCGVFSAIAAILLISRMGSTFPHSGTGTEMRVVSACIIGGCSISGGKGTIIGSYLGVLLLALISNILVLLNVSINWQGVVSGAVLILAVLSDVFVNRKR
ncbi:MAG: ABC transporter permease [Planctomycetota bacterium]|jgi:ribose transport system permease protein|nr:ABC transporter permease [Planctomycetota bacterium]